MIILAGLPDKQNISEYYEGLKKLFAKYELEIKNNDPAEIKCKLLDFYNKPSKPKEEEFSYLGYKIVVSKDDKGYTQAKFGMSDNKVEKIKRKIDAAFNHFEKVSKKNIKQAKRDLLDSLNLISGNYRLAKSKERVKAGLFFGNDLLTDLTDLENLNTYLSNKQVIPYIKVLNGSDDRQKYIESIQRKIRKIDFKQRWEDHIMFKFSPQRLAEISSWLS